MPVTQSQIDTIAAATATGGTAATGTILFNKQPNNNDTLTINGRVFTFRTSPTASDPYQVGRGSSATTAADAFVTKFAAAPDSEVTAAGAANVSGTVTFTYKNTGTLGNSYTLDASDKVTTTYVGSIRFAANPEVNDTVVFQDTSAITYTFTAGATSGQNIQIGANPTATALAFRNVLAGLGSTYLFGYTYTINATDPTQIDIVAKATGDRTLTVTGVGVPARIIHTITTPGYTSRFTVTAMANGADGTGTVWEALTSQINTNSAFERSMVALMGVVDFVLRNGVSGEVDQQKAERQRRTLKDVLNQMGASIKKNAKSTDDRTEVADATLTKNLRKFNALNRPSDL